MTVEDEADESGHSCMEDPYNDVHTVARRISPSNLSGVCFSTIKVSMKWNQEAGVGRSNEGMENRAQIGKRGVTIDTCNGQKSWYPY